MTTYSKSLGIIPFQARITGCGSTAVSALVGTNPDADGHLWITGGPTADKSVLDGISVADALNYAFVVTEIDVETLGTNTYLSMYAHILDDGTGNINVARLDATGLYSGFEYELDAGNAIAIIGDNAADDGIVVVRGYLKRRGNVTRGHPDAWTITAPDTGFLANTKMRATYKNGPRKQLMIHGLALAQVDGFIYETTEDIVIRKLKIKRENTEAEISFGYADNDAAGTNFVPFVFVGDNYADSYENDNCGFHVPAGKQLWWSNTDGAGTNNDNFFTIVADVGLSPNQVYLEGALEATDATAATLKLLDLPESQRIRIDRVHFTIPHAGTSAIFGWDGLASGGGADPVPIAQSTGIGNPSFYPSMAYITKSRDWAMSLGDADIDIWLRNEGAAASGANTIYCYVEGTYV